MRLRFILSIFAALCFGAVVSAQQVVTMGPGGSRFLSGQITVTVSGGRVSFSDGTFVFGISTPTSEPLDRVALTFFGGDAWNTWGVYPAPGPGAIIPEGATHVTFIAYNYYRAVTQSGTWGGVQNLRSPIMTVPIVPQVPQSVTVTPTSAEIGSSGSVLFTAAGAETSYEWQSSGGPGSLSALTGEDVVFLPPGQGTFTIEVRAVADETHLASPWASAVVVVGNPKTVTVPIPANSGQYPVIWSVYQLPSGGGDAVGMDTITMNPGDPALIKSYASFPLGDGVPVHVSWKIDHVEWDGIADVWRYAPGGAHNSNPTSQLPGGTGGTGGSGAPGVLIPPPVVGPSGPVPSGEPTGTPASGPVSSGTMWVTGGGSGGSAEYTGPTDSTFREGITKLERQLIDANASLREIAGRESGEGEPQPDGSGIAGDASALADGAAGWIPAGMSSGGPAPATTDYSSSDIWLVSLPLPVGGPLNLNFDPAAHPFFSALARFVRSLLVWVATIGLVLGLVVNTDKALAAICSVPSTTAGPTSVLGTGSSIPVALIKAGLIVAALALAIPALYAVFNSDVGGVGLLARLLSNPVNEAVGDAGASGGWLVAFREGVRLANFFVPIDYIFLCFGTWWFHKITSVTAIVTVSTYIRAVGA